MPDLSLSLGMGMSTVRNRSLAYICVWSGLMLDCFNENESNVHFCCKISSPIYALFLLFSLSLKEISLNELK